MGKTKLKILDERLCGFKEKKCEKIIWLPLFILPLFNFLSALFSGSRFNMNQAIPFLLGAVAEELFYRWFMLQHLLLPRIKAIQAIILVSLLFSCMHFFNLRAGAPLLDTFLQVFFAFCFSIWAGAVVWKTNSILGPLAAHVLLNITSSDTPSIAVVLIMSFFVLTDGIFLIHTRI